MVAMPSPKTSRWWTGPLTLLRRILMLDDTPHSIAMGVAIGMFIGITPTVGLQMLLVMILAAVTARLFRFNRIAALLTVYVSNPITTVPIYYFNYKVGTLFVEGNVTRRDFEKLLQYDGIGEWCRTIVGLFIEVGTPLILGSLIVASVCSAISYPVMRWMLRVFKRRWNVGADESSPPGSGASGGVAA